MVGVVKDLCFEVLCLSCLSAVLELACRAVLECFRGWGVSIVQSADEHKMLIDRRFIKHYPSDQ